MMRLIGIVLLALFLSAPAWAQPMPGGGAGGGGCPLTGCTIGGVTVLSTPTATANGTLTLVGHNAGLNINLGAFETTAVGDNAAGACGSGLTAAGVENTFIGWHSGCSGRTLTFATAVGVNTMGFDPSGGGSVAVGTDAMRNEVGGNGTVSIGQNAGRNGTAYNGNVFIGTNAGQGLDFGGGSSCATGCANPVGVTAIGYNAFSAQSNTTAQNAVVVGNSAGSSLTGGAGFVLVGTNAGLTAASPVDATTVGNAAGVSNNGVVIGSKAGAGAPTGIGGGNVLVGYQNAQNITSGHDNLILGTQVAPTLTTGAANTIIGRGSTTDVPNASMSFMLNIENMIYLNTATKTAPALSACGTSPVIDAHANNRSGTITAGSGALASCTMTFAGTGYASWNHCRVTSQAAVASPTYSYTLTTLTVAGTSITSDKFDYDCDGY